MIKNPMIGNRVVVGFPLEIDRIERENGIVTVAGRVELEDGKKVWVNVPLECCAENFEERKCLHETL
jgi:hypothetical protein